MKVAVVTGASRGLGRALARSLSDRGWRLVIDARGEPALLEVAGTLGESVRAIPGDVADRDHRLAIAAAVGRLGRLDLLVNNAGTLGPTPLPGLARAGLNDAADALYTNAVAPLGLIQLLVGWLERSGGSIVNVTSDAAQEGFPGWGVYGASKAALEAYGRVLAAEHPELGIYAFDPGDMRTKMHQDAFSGEDISDRPDPESVVPALLALVDTRPPSGRYGVADFVGVR